MRKACNLYRSHYEQTKLLNKTQKCDIFTAICEVQFLEKHIDNIEFSNKVTQLVWIGIKHSLKTSIDGYCSKMQIDYDKTLAKAVQKGLEQDDDNKEKKKEKYKDKQEGEGEEEISTLPPIVQPDLESDAKIVANYLLQKILDNKPNFKKPDLRVWEQDIEKAIKNDGRTAQELIGCINWIYSHDGNFWIPIILSAQKLRQKFDVMESQMVNNPKNKSRNKTALVLAKVGY
jgi:hypothetical protein